MKLELDISKTIFLILFVILSFFLVVSAPDFFWHLKTGEYILTRGRLPRVDPFSYTRAGSPWILHEWLFEVICFSIYQKLGIAGIRVLVATLVVLSFYLAFLSAKTVFRQPVIISLVTLAGCIVIVPNLIPRPQLITYLFFSVTLFALIKFKYSGSKSYLWAVPPMMVVWVNMHGGYIVGIALLCIATVSEFVMAWSTGEQVRRGCASTLLKVTLVTMACTLVNPYFIKLWVYPFQVMSMSASRFILEWQSNAFQGLRGKWYLLLVIGFYTLNIYRTSKPDLTELILPSFFIAASFVSSRHIPLAILAMIPFTGVAFAQGVFLSCAESKIGKIYRQYFASSGQIGSSETILNLGLLAFVIIMSLLILPYYRPVAETHKDELLPIKAAEFIIKNNLNGKMFNEYRFGGYLIYRLYPRQKVFIDGRVDMYGDEFFNEYRKIYLGGPGWEKDFAKYGIDYVICSNQAPIRQLLLTRGDFRLVYVDSDDSVLVKDIPRYSAIIAKYGRSRPHGNSPNGNRT